VKVEVTGAKFRTSRLRKLLPIYAEGAVDEDLLLEGRRNLRDTLQREGYFDSQVSYTTSEDTKSGEQVIKYEISRGPQHRLTGVSFDGNKYFGTKLLRSRLFIETSSYASRGRFSPQMVKDDADLIRETYISNGFREAQVSSEVLDDHRGNTGNLLVRFHITEGPQALVAELKLEGNHAFKDDELLAVIGSATGQPFSDANISADRDNILALYYNEGFPGAHFESQAVETGTPNRVRLTYRITEGSQVKVERVLLAGYEHTRPGTIARQVQVKAGGPLREGEVIETQRRLYSLGIFTRVAVAPQNPTGTDEDKTVVVEVEEGNRYTFGYGFGFEVQRLAGRGGSDPTSGSLSASPRVILELTKANFGGRAQTLSFKVRASTLQYRGLVSYSVPDFFAHHHFSLLLTGFADKSTDVQTFTSRRYEGSFQINQAVSQSTTLLYRYFFRRVTVGNLQINPEQIPLFSQPTLTSGFGATYVRDRRNNPGDASRGSFNTFDVGLAARSLGSSAGFLRIIFQNSSFHPIGRSLVFARSVRFGVEKTMPGTTAAEVPLPEKFFAGGGASLRGLGLNQAGPRDPVTGFPIGGLALLVFNQELRFPMRLPFVGNRIGGAVFYDGGNVYSDFRHITFSASPSANNMNNLNYFSHTIGFGFRYATPVGPVRLDLGYQLNPPKFSFLNTTTNMVQVSQLPHFQFFFNIGSIF
jgi:outer membrane protein insertion porin family